MSERDDAPDPMDKAYRQAEAVLDDETARATRRARVLAAVARDGITPAVLAKRRAPLRYGWLAAASVAGLSLLLAVQLTAPLSMRKETPEAMPAAPPLSAPMAAAVPPAAPATAPKASAPLPVVVARASPFPAEARSVPDTQAFEGAAPTPLPSPPVQASAAPPPAPVASMAPESVADSLATPRRAASSQAAGARAPSVTTEARAPASPADRGERLRAAAAAGRLAELSTLLSEGAFADAPDPNGDTALMKSVRANRPAAAALLRRYGASLDLRNRAGLSARDMAGDVDNPELDRALGLEN